MKKIVLILVATLTTAFIGLANANAALQSFEIQAEGSDSYVLFLDEEVSKSRAELVHVLATAHIQQKCDGHVNPIEVIKSHCDIEHIKERGMRPYKHVVCKVVLKGICTVVVNTN